MNGETFEEALKRIFKAFKRGGFSEIIIKSKGAQLIRIPTLLAAILLLVCGFPSRITGALLLIAVLSGTEAELTMGKASETDYTVGSHHTGGGTNEANDADYDEYTVE